MQAPKPKVDLNTLLTGANLLVLGLLVIEMFSLRVNTYVNDQTLLLGVLLCVEVQFALILERFNRDPFVMLLSFTMIFYYAVRVLTLSLWGVSDVLGRYPFDAEDTNFALFYILIANLLLYAGLFSVRTKRDLRINADNWKATSSGRVIIALLASVAFTYLGGVLWSGGLPRGLGFLVLVFSPGTLLLMVLAYYILFRENLGHVTAAAIIFLIVLELVAHTIAGSRSAIVGLVQTCLLVMLALWGRIRLNRGLAVLGVIAVPIFFALIVATFAISTYTRFARISGQAPDIERAVEFATMASRDPLIVARLSIIAPAIASRAGFFDYSAEIIAHREHYAVIFNGPTYARSIVDNLLTPGLDLFDQPKIANSLRFVYQRWGTPSKTYVAENYQSDQIGLYGEFFVLFGWASLPLLFMITFVLKRIYVRLSSPNPYFLAMKRIVVLFVFVRMLDSFGMDWTIIEVVPFVFSIFLFAKFFTTRPVGIDAPGLAVSRA